MKTELYRKLGSDDWTLETLRANFLKMRYEGEHSVLPSLNQNQPELSSHHHVHRMLNLRSNPIILQEQPLQCCTQRLVHLSEKNASIAKRIISPTNAIHTKRPTPDGVSCMVIASFVSVKPTTPQTAIDRGPAFIARIKPIIEVCVTNKSCFQCFSKTGSYP